MYLSKKQYLCSVIYNEIQIIEQNYYIAVL